MNQAGGTSSAITPTAGLLLVAFLSAVLLAVAYCVWVGVYRLRFSRCRRVVGALHPGWHCCWATPTSTQVPILDEKGDVDPSADFMFAYGADGVELWRMRGPLLLFHLDRTNISQMCVTSVEHRSGSASPGLRITSKNGDYQDVIVHAENPHVVGPVRRSARAILLADIARAIDLRILRDSSTASWR